MWIQHAQQREFESELLPLRLQATHAILWLMCALGIWLPRQEAKGQLCVSTKRLQEPFRLWMSLSTDLCSKEDLAQLRTALPRSLNSPREPSSEQTATTSNMHITTSQSLLISLASTTLSLEQLVFLTCWPYKFQEILLITILTTWAPITRSSMTPYQKPIFSLMFTIAI